MSLVEMGAEAVIDGLLVLVEPVAFICSQHFHEDRGCEDGAEGEMLKCVVRTEGKSYRFFSVVWVACWFYGFAVFCGKIGIDNEHGVFMTDTMASLDVDAWFIGDYHSREKWLWPPLHTKLFRIREYIFQKRIHLNIKED